MNFLNAITSYFDGSSTNKEASKSSDDVCNFSLSCSLCGAELAGVRANLTTPIGDSPLGGSEDESVMPEEPVSSVESDTEEDEMPTGVEVTEYERAAPIVDTKEPSKSSVLGRFQRPFKKKSYKLKNDEVVTSNVSTKKSVTSLKTPSKPSSEKSASSEKNPPKPSSDQTVEDLTAKEEDDAFKDEAKLSKPGILRKVRRSFRAAKAEAKSVDDSPLEEASDTPTDTATHSIVAPTDDFFEESSNAGVTEETNEQSCVVPEVALFSELGFDGRQGVFPEVALFSGLGFNGEQNSKTNYDETESLDASFNQTTEEQIEELTVEKEGNDQAKLSNPDVRCKMKHSLVKKAASRTGEEGLVDESLEVCDVDIIDVNDQVNPSKSGILSKVKGSFVKATARAEVPLDESLEVCDVDTIDVNDRVKPSKSSILSNLKGSFVKATASRADEAAPLDKSVDVYDGTPSDTNDQVKPSKTGIFSKVKGSFVKATASRPDEEAPLYKSVDVCDVTPSDASDQVKPPKSGILNTVEGLFDKVTPSCTDEEVPFDKSVDVCDVTPTDANDQVKPSESGSRTHEENSCDESIEVCDLTPNNEVKVLRPIILSTVKRSFVKAKGSRMDEEVPRDESLEVCDTDPINETVEKTEEDEMPEDDKMPEDEASIKEAESGKIVFEEEYSTKPSEESPFVDTDGPSKPSVFGRIKHSFHKNSSKSKDVRIGKLTAENEVDAPEEEAQLVKPNTNILRKVKRSIRTIKPPAIRVSKAPVEKKCLDTPAETTANSSVTPTGEALLEESFSTGVTEETMEDSENKLKGDEIESLSVSVNQVTEGLIEEMTVEKEAEDVNDQAAKLSKPSILSKVKRSFVKKAASRTDEDASLDESSKVCDAAPIIDETDLSKPSILNKVKRSFVKKSASHTDEEALLDEPLEVRDDAPIEETELAKPSLLSKVKRSFAKKAASCTDDEEALLDEPSETRDVSLFHETARLTEGTDSYLDFPSALDNPVKTKETHVLKGIASTLSVEDETFIVSESLPAQISFAAE